MMTPEEARRVIQSHKFVENHFIYGVAKRQANRAINEVDTNIVQWSGAASALVGNARHEAAT